MSTIRWTGNAPRVAQLNTLTVGGTAADGQVYSVTIGGQVISYTANVTGGDTNTTIATSLYNKLIAATVPGVFKDMTWANPSAGVITATANVSGVPFTNTSAATGTGTFVTAITTASSGPNDASVAANYSTGSLPVNSDSLYLQNTSSSLLYGLSALSSVTLTLLQIDASFTGTVGLPYTNATGGYAEYRPTYFQVSATTVTIGLGSGSGSGRLKLDLGSVVSTMTVYSTGTSLDSTSGIPTLLIKGSNASNVAYLLKGSVGFAIFASETAEWAIDCGFQTNQQGDVQCTIGQGTTVVSVNKTGGVLTSYAAIPTLTHYAGTTTIYAGNMTTCTVYGGTVRYWTGGTITTDNVYNGGTLDLSGSQASKTFTHSNWYKGATINDPAGTVTYTNPVAIPDGTWDDITAALGINRTYAIT